MSINWDVTPPYINTWSHYCFGTFRTAGSVTATSLAWPLANLAVFVPLTIPWPYVVRRLFWVHGSSPGGSHSIGLYRSDGTGLFVSGAVTGSGGASNIQFVTPASPIQLAPGRYFLGYAVDNTTSNRVTGNAIAASVKRLIGVYEQASAFPLPTTATFATPSNTTVMFAGITRVV